MKDGLRLAQSLGQEVIDEIGFFCFFSRPPGVISAASKKRDSRRVFCPDRPHAGMLFPSPATAIWCRQMADRQRDLLKKLVEWI
jgi:hypothetical protein